MTLSLKTITNILVVLFAWLCIFSNFISFTFGGIVYVVFEYFLLFLSFIYCKSKNNDKKKYIYKASISFTFFIILFALGSQLLMKTATFVSLGGLSLTSHTYNSIVNLPIWLSCFLLLLTNDKQDNCFVANILFFVLLYDISISIIAHFNEPSYARNLTAMITTDKMMIFRRLGAFGYELTYSMSILSPFLLFFGFKNKKIKWIVIGVLGIILVIKSMFLIAIVALLMNTILSFFLGQKNKTKRLFMMILLIIFVALIVFNISFIGEQLLLLSVKMQGNDLSRRLFQLGSFLSSGDLSGDSLIRLDLYLNSLLGIASHPIFGNLIFNVNYVVSGHSALLNIWEAFGLFPFILFLSALFFVYRHITYNISDSSTRYVIFSSFITFVFIAIFNAILSSPQIVLSVFFVIPVVMQTSNYSKEEQTSLDINTCKKIARSTL